MRPILYNSTHTVYILFGGAESTRSPIYSMAPKGRHPGPRWFWRHDIGCLEDVPGLCLWGASAGLFPRDIIYGTPGTLVVRPIIITSNIATEEEQQVVVAFVLLLNVCVRLLLPDHL